MPADGPSFDHPGLVRLDDLTLGHSHRFDGHRSTFVARTADEVVPVLRAAEAAALGGAWVVGFLAYEAAAAFDRAFTVAGPPSVPLCWFAAFDRREPIAGLDQADPPTHRVLGVRRQHVGLSYPAAVEAIRDRIALGDVYQVNHTERLVGSLQGTPLDLYTSMALAQRGAYNAYLDLGDVVIASASPELFLRWDGDTIATKPMKGTVVRGRRLEDDEAQRAELVEDPKQRAENVMIVDLLRNDLSRVATVGSVQVPKLFEPERYETVWQLTSTVTATARSNIGLAEVFAAMFPCGSITGAPKASAMSIIAGLEKQPRGIYCGAIGVLAPPGHGPRATFSVAIRTAVVSQPSGSLIYGAGGGITWSSDPLTEDAEVTAKARVLTERRPPMQLIETMLLEVDGIRNRTQHLQRLAFSALWFGFAIDVTSIAEQLDGLGQPATPQRVRLLLARDGALTVTATPLDRVAPTVRLALATGRVRSDDVFCLHKTTNRAVYEAARAEHPTADDVLLINERGEVVETTIANLLYQRDNTWWTPPLSCGGLDGIGRGVELRAGRIGERVLQIGDLGLCESFAVISSLRGIRPATLLPPG